MYLCLFVYKQYMYRLYTIHICTLCTLCIDRSNWYRGGRGELIITTQRGQGRATQPSITQPQHPLGKKEHALCHIIWRETNSRTFYLCKCLQEQISGMQVISVSSTSDLCWEFFASGHLVPFLNLEGKCNEMQRKVLFQI